VHTTCLSETIGEDLNQISAKAREENRVPPGKYLIHANTPSYIGSHITGFSNMVKGMVSAFPTAGGFKNKRVNIIPGFVEPSDMTEMKRIAGLMGIATIVFPDTSGVLNGPQTGAYEMYPRGGATVAQLKEAGDSCVTLALGPLASGPAAQALDVKCKVPCCVLPLPIGIRATDEFVMALREHGGSVVDDIEYERGQAVDAITDLQQYFVGKKVALIGDPDHLVPLSGFLSDIGFMVRHVVTGTPGKKIIKRVREAIGDDSANVRELSDYFYAHQLIKNERVDIVFGNTYAKYMCRDMNIPHVRVGFPIYDRVGHQYFPVVGYRGALRLVERIQAALLDKYDRECPEEKFELIM
jgi:nitrogenase molybdenum-iron protein beta chain